MAVGHAHGPVARVRLSVAVFDPGRSLLRGRPAPLHVHRDRRLRAHAPAEGHELVRPDVAGLSLVLPSEVRPEGTPVAGTDAPPPVIVLGDVAARPADERGTQGGDARLDVGP